MDKLLSQLDPKARLGISSAGYVLALLSGVFGVGMLPSGPWWAAFLLCLIGASLLTFAHSAWPAKIPEGLQVVKERWEKSRSRATKSPAGKFMWGAGRAAIAAFIGSNLIPVEMDGGFMKWAFVGGFAVSVGFFGIRAAAWAGIIVFLLGHRIAATGLGVDFADQPSREAFWIAWTKGAQISWWWPIGFAVSPFVWTGLAALMVKVGAALSESIKERQAAAAAQEKIDARRKRLRDKQSNDSVDLVAAAAQATEQALKKAGNVGTGDPGTVKPGKKIDAEGDAAKELTGVEKIQHELNGKLLKGYADIARSLTKSQADKLDVDTANKRAFDRKVLSLTDDQKDFLRETKEPWGADLLDYFNKLCNVEDAAMRGGDGDVVTASSGAGSMDELARVGGAPLPLLEENGSTVMGDLLDQEEDALDALDAQAQPALVSRRDFRTNDLNMMISAAGVSGDDGGSEVSSEDRLDDLEQVDEPVAGLMDEQAADDEESEDAAPEAVEGLVENEAETPEIQENETADAQEVETTEAVGDEAVVAEAVEDQAEEPVLETAVEDNEETGAVQAEEPTAPAVEVSADQLRVVAGRIMSGHFDREFVLSSIGYFRTADEVAQLFGIPSSIFEANFTNYSAMSEAAQREIALKALVEAGDVEGVRSSLELVKESAGLWPCEDAVSEAEGWLTAREEEERARIEQERLAEEQRQREEEDRRAEEERIRAAEEARLAEEERQRQETERLAREAEAEAERLRQEAEAEAARLAELEQQRGAIAARIVVGALSDEVIEIGAELFKTAEDLAAAMMLDVAHVEERFSAFATMRDGKAQWDKIAKLYGDEDSVLQVKELLADEAALASYTHPTMTMENVRKWVDVIEEKKRLLGLEEGKEKQAAPTVNAGRAYMKKRYGTTPEMIDVIEKRLPEAITAAQKLAQAIEVVGDDPHMKGLHSNALLKVAEAAALLVEQEKTCRDYAKAFFPKEMCGGKDVWDAIVEMAKQAPENAAGVEVASTPAAEGRKPEATKPKPQEGMSKVVDARRSLADVQALDAAHEISLIEREPIPARETLENAYRMTLVGVFGDDLDVHSDDGFPFYHVYLKNDAGERIGRIRVISQIDSIPVWYDDSREIIHYIVPAKGIVQEKPETVARTGLDGTMRHSGEESEQILGLVIVSPYLTVDGQTTFEPWLKKFQNGPVRIVHNLMFTGPFISAFVKEVTKA